MRNYLIVILFIVFSCSQFTAFAQNDTIWYDNEWNETSKFHAEFYRPQPKKTKGKYIIKDYFIDGNLQMEGASVEQDTVVFDDTVMRYYQSGVTQSTVNYNNGKLQGPATQYYEDGLVQRIITFNDGVQHGEYKEYYTNGQLRGTINYKNDVINGVYQEFHDNGNKKTYLFYIQGKKHGDYLEYFYDGNIQYSGHYENDMLQGDTKMYDTEGNLKNSGSFIDNQKHGVWKTVGYDNTIVTRTYDKEILNGEMTFEMQRNEADIEQFYKGRGEYENGKLISWTLEKKHKENYKPYRVMSLENDNAVWKNYNDKGTLFSEVSYGQNNIEDGNWKFYYPNGKLKHDVNFVAKDCFNKLYEIEETVIESVDDQVYDDANSSPGIPSAYLPDELIKQETFDFYYQCEASAQGNYTHFYKNGKPKLKATFKDGKLIETIQLFNKKNKKTTIHLDEDASEISALVKITPIEIDSYVDIDYSVVEPEPFEIVLYYENSYGNSKIRNTIVHPILKSYISNLNSVSLFFTEVRTRLNENEGVNFELNNFTSRFYYSLKAYQDFTYED